MLTHPTNLFPGINPHLNSRLQTQGGWDAFHTLYISDLTRTMNTQLMPLGYEADIEQSLQIKRVNASSRFPTSDVTIYEDAPKPNITPAGQAATMARVVPNVDLLAIQEADQQHYKSVVVYETPKHGRGEPVAWLELLSPSNKPQGRDFEVYRAKRDLILRTGLVYLEIDFLHQQPPTFNTLADYTQDDHAAPFRIILVEARPTLLEGTSHIHEFHIDARLPTVHIPLSGDDVFTFDFGTPYQKTFEEMGYGRKIDYNQLPVKLDTYSTRDRTYIVNRLIAIHEAHQNGIPLNINALQMPSMSLDKGLQKLAVFGVKS